MFIANLVRVDATLSYKTGTAHDLFRPGNVPLAQFASSSPKYSPVGAYMLTEFWFKRMALGPFSHEIKCTTPVEVEIVLEKTIKMWVTPLHTSTYAVDPRVLGQIQEQQVGGKRGRPVILSTAAGPHGVMSHSGLLYLQELHVQGAPGTVPLAASCLARAPAPPPPPQVNVSFGSAADDPSRRLGAGGVVGRVLEVPLSSSQSTGAHQM